ncbi:MAG: ATPase, T2SS/T4P/T4SS family, partial [Candidatus Weimeria sp.]
RTTAKNGKEPYEISAEKAAELKNSGHFYGKIKTDFKYSGCGLPYTDDEIRVMVCVIFSAVFGNNAKSRWCALAVKDKNKKDWLEVSLRHAHIKYKKSEKADGTVRYSFDAPKREKEFSSFWYDSSSEQLGILIAAIDTWAAYKHGAHKEIKTYDKASADFIQFVFHANGMRAEIMEKTSEDDDEKKTVYTLRIFKNTYVGMEPHNDGRKQNKVEEVSPSDGYKYCFTVFTHALVLRRNGRIFITGNSGKTVILNWFLEKAYEDSADILVIQENEELFAYSKQQPQYRKGVKFQHVVNYSTNGEKPVSLEELGQLALVAGANVFIIGEAKGAEICSAITLSNSGCRTAITIHSPSSTETIDKMADLAMRGYASDMDQAKRMLKSFQTIVYLQDFKVQEISEITGYDEKKHDMTYRYIYRRGAGKDGK